MATQDSGTYRKWKGSKNRVLYPIISVIFQLACGIVGFTLVWIFGSWQLALGIFLLMWGNNIMLHDNVKDMFKKILPNSKRY